MAVSKRLRYEILRRDNHTCRYCGAKSPDAELTVDHVVPVALGGTDEPTNLVAACKDCNSGKTSASPDAPVVADVSEDAIRWSRAMAEAANQMRAEFAKRQDIYDQFEDWWSNWTYGFKKLPLPRPEDWRNSVDSFLAAGLPLDVLKWCVDKAGGSKAAPDQTWRYMCGVAWKKVTEFQQAARSITDGRSPEGEDGGPQTPGQYAEHLLKMLGDKDREKAFRDEDRTRDDPPESDEGRSAGAAWFAFSNILCDREILAKSLVALLGAWPDGRGTAQLAQARQNLEDRFGPDFDENCALTNAAWEIAQEVGAREAEAYLAALPAGQREAWIERARIVWAEIDWAVDDEFYVTEAADLARKAAAEAPA